MKSVAFSDDCEMATGKHFKHNGNSKSIYGVGEDKIDDNDGTIGFERAWGNGLNVVGIKDGKQGRTVRLHSTHLKDIIEINTRDINTRNLTSTWGTGGDGAGIVKIARLQVDQLSGYAWNSDAINITNNKLVFRTSQGKDIIEFGKVPAAEGNTDDQSMVLLNNTELRIKNNNGWYTHFNHKTRNSYYSNWIRKCSNYAMNIDGIVVINDTFHCNSLSYFNKLVTANVVKFDSLNHKSGDGQITRENGQFCIKGDDIIDLKGMVRIRPPGAPRDALQIFNNINHYFYVNNENATGFIKHR